MGFASGSISFRRFVVVGKRVPSVPDQALLDKLAEHVLEAGELGVPEEIEYGWSGGRHILDGSFSFEHNVFGEAMSFALRIDTNKVPAEMRKAYQFIEEEAVASGNPSGFISKAQRKDVKDSIRQKIDDEMRSGKYRRSKLLQVLWDLPTQTVYCSASGTSFEKLAELFERTFGLELVPLTAGSQALRFLEAKGKRRDYEDFRPTRFVTGAEGEGVHPEYPWVIKGSEPKDFLGNEFLLWLWHEADARTGIVTTDGAGDVTVYFDRLLDLDCAYGQSGRDSLRGDGPSRGPEAIDALRTGKVPRKAGLVLDAGRQQFSLTFNPETLAVTGAKLPDVEEAEDARQLFEARIELLRDLCESLDGLYETFLKTRAGAAWESHTGAIRRWIMAATKTAAA